VQGFSNRQSSYPVAGANLRPRYAVSVPFVTCLGSESLLFVGTFLSLTLFLVSTNEPPTPLKVPDKQVAYSSQKATKRLRLDDPRLFSSQRSFWSDPTGPEIIIYWFWGPGTERIYGAGGSRSFKKSSLWDLRLHVRVVNTHVLRTTLQDQQEGSSVLLPQWTA